MEKLKMLSQKKENFFFHILIKNHVQTSRKKVKEKLLTKTNRGIKRSQSCEEGGWNQIPIFSLDKLGKKLSQKSTREILAWQKYPKVLLQNAQVIHSFHKHLPNSMTATFLHARKQTTVMWREDTGSGPRSHKSQFCHQSAVRPWINCLTSAHVLIYNWRW